MRVCIAYDCLFPWTVGGHERYLRELAEALARRGHEITYVTRRQWPEREPPLVPGVRVVAVSKEEPLYDEQGRRRIGEAIRYGIGVGRHLLRHRRAYDAVHLVGFPYFSIPAARLALLGTRARVVVDWPEVWSRAYWREYLGGIQGLVGLLVQRLCIRLTPEAFVESELHGKRLREEGHRGEVTLLPAPVAELPAPHPAPAPDPPLALFVGRMISEKRAPAVVAAIAHARRAVPGLRGLLVGDGPELAEVRRAIERHGLAEAVRAPGFLPAPKVRAAFAGATCLVAPSSREGYGLVVLEAAAAGTPSIVVKGPDNAMVERIAEGENGLVADDATPAALGDAIAAICADPQAWRDRTQRWFAAESRRLAAALPVDVVEPRYAAGSRL